MKLDGLARRAALGVLAPLVRPRPLSREELRREPLERILVVRQDDRIGNLLFVTPVLTGLAAMFPEARIDLVISSRFAEILASHPAVSRQILFDRRGARRAPVRLIDHLRDLRRVRYDLVIDCKPEPSLSNTLVVLLARARFRLGFEHEFSKAMYDLTVREPEQRLQHESERLYILIREVWDAPPCPPMSFPFPPERVPRGTPEGVALHIGGHGRKRIPRVLLDSLIDALRRAGFPLRVLAGPEELELAGDLESRFPGLDVLRPPDVIDLAACIAGSRAFIGPDTGALHIASALDVPTVNLCVQDVSPVYGPRSTHHVVIGFGGDRVVERAMEFLEAILTPHAGVPPSA